jgi:hypothetical protein
MMTTQHVTKSFKKIKSLVKNQSVAVIEFYDPEFGGRRRRKIYKDGSCKTSYYGIYSSKWSKYTVACFVAWNRKKELNNTLSIMRKHDKPLGIYPVAFIVNKERTLL